MRKVRFVILLVVIGFTSYAQSLDFSMLRAINKGEHPDWDKTMKITSNSIYPVMVIAPGSLLLTGYVNNDKVMIRDGVKTIAAIGLNLILTASLKYSFRRERPFVQYPNDIVKRENVTSWSFPSGHTSSAFVTEIGRASCRERVCYPV